MTATPLPMPSSDRRRFALVFNAQAGIAVPRLLDGLLALLRETGCEVFQLPARSAVEASEKVADATAREVCDAVIAAGGDGTFRAVATGAAGTSMPVGLVPLGTGNVLAHELSLVRRPAPIADVLLSGPVVTAYGGRANGEPFFLMAGAGFDGKIIANLNYRTKRVAGRAAFTWPVIDTLWRGAEEFDVAIDGAPPQSASWVIVTRAAHYGGSFRLTNATCVGHEAMVAVVIAAKTRRELVAASLALPFGSIVNPSRRPSFVSVQRADRVEIGRCSPVAIEIDGDAAGYSPLVVEAGGPTVQLIVPPKYAARCASVAEG